jgi:hypothetical protein
MWIERAISKHVEAVAKQFPAVLVTGPRQTGKTTLLEHLFPEASFVTLDLPSVALTEAKWAEVLTDARPLASLLKVRAELGDRAADVHQVACRTPVDHALPHVPGVRLVNAATLRDWV